MLCCHMYSISNVYLCDYRVRICRSAFAIAIFNVLHRYKFILFQKPPLSSSSTPPRHSPPAAPPSSRRYSRLVSQLNQMHTCDIS